MEVANLLDFDRDALAVFCERLGEKRFRATQLFRWIHQKGAADFSAMSDLAKSLRDKLQGVAEVRPLAVLSEQASSDGTIKWLFDVGAGDAVETVFIPEDDRGTLCISSQAGLRRRLPLLLDRTPGIQPQPERTSEIVAQLWFAEHQLRRRLDTARRRAASITNVRDDGHGRTTAELFAALAAGASARCSTITAMACRGAG